MRRPRNGQSMAELALLLPLLLLIVLGCLDLGRAFSVWMALANGTREGARYAASHPAEGALIEALTREYIEAEGWSGEALQVTVSAAAAGGQPMVVSAVYSLSLVTGALLGGGPVDIAAQAQMQVLQGLALP